MEKLPEPHQHLKDSLLSGSISAQDFLKSVLDIDQSTIERENCFENLKLLENPEVAAFIQTQSPEDTQKYHRLLSLTTFHIAQNLALSTESPNIEDIVSYIQQSIQHEDLGTAFPGNQAYHRATLAYFQNNIPDLEKYTAEYARYDDWNIPILENMKKGLIARGGPNYVEDYKM